MELLILTGKKFTALYPQTKRKVELLDKDIFDRIQKWKMFSAVGALELNDYFGNKISYKGIKYKGSPESVYWLYFQPFFDHEIPKLLSEVEETCHKKGLEPDIYVEEASDFLKVMIRRLWHEIAKTDQGLKGNGFPKDADLKDISGTIEFYNKKLDAELEAILFCENTTNLQIEPAKEDLVDLKPNFFGLGVNLNAVYRRLKSWQKNM
ncbi:hypothetical protein [Vibrio splendidus]|uniref:Uncharacterized protein n=1 Tax=Vibrio splendidus TaxID=29497 RepID=A0A837NSI4_VIBSP|nr:hypothetical protein [Vibrio splendidus]KPL94628.1 hypothetical protein AN168_08910 [Vibrio splendidus]TVU60789.1 hypothetical protein FQP88_15820 [Vibrio atlanticus]